jgi:hypothetical protein
MTILSGVEPDKAGQFVLGQAHADTGVTQGH